MKMVCDKNPRKTPTETLESQRVGEAAKKLFFSDPSIKDFPPPLELSGNIFL